MKKVVWFSIFSLFIVSSAMAQELHLGIKGGANMTKIDGSKFKDQFQLNYYAGAYLGLSLSEKFGIEPEVLFSQSTYKTTEGFSSVYTDFPDVVDGDNVQLNYLSIPILANIKLGEKFWLQAGPQYSILINDDKNLIHNSQNAFKNGDFSLVGGFILHFSSLTINARYIIGMSDVYDVGNEHSWKSQAIQVGLGYEIF